MLGRCTTALRPLRHCWKETGLESQLEFGLSSAETPLPAPPKAARLGCGVLLPAASFPPSGTSPRSRGAGRCLRGAPREGKAQWFKGRSAAAPGRDFSPGCSSSLPSPAALRGWGGFFPAPGFGEDFPAPGFGAGWRGQSFVLRAVPGQGGTGWCSARGGTGAWGQRRALGGCRERTGRSWAWGGSGGCSAPRLSQRR